MISWLILVVVVLLITCGTALFLLGNEKNAIKDNQNKDALNVVRRFLVNIDDKESSFSEKCMAEDKVIADMRGVIANAESIKAKNRSNIKVVSFTRNTG